MCCHSSKASCLAAPRLLVLQTQLQFIALSSCRIFRQRLSALNHVCSFAAVCFLCVVFNAPELARHSSAQKNHDVKLLSGFQSLPFFLKDAGLCQVAASICALAARLTCCFCVVFVQTCWASCARLPCGARQGPVGPDFALLQTIMFTMSRFPVMSTATCLRQCHSTIAILKIGSHLSAAFTDMT